MLQRFLVPLDATPGAETVLPLVTVLAKALRQPVVMLSVLPDTATLDGSIEHAPMIDSLTETRKRYAQQYLDGISAEFGAAGVTASAVVETGPAADTVLATAIAMGAGMIVMASHTATGPERWFLGSVADRVIRTPSVPVLVIPQPGDGAAAASAIREIIVPLDGSGLAEAALPYASFLARSLPASITLLRAAPPNLMITAPRPYGTDAALPTEILVMLGKSAQAYLEGVAAPLRDQGIGVATRFTAASSPADSIAELAGQTAGSLVVMATHGQSGLGRVLLGSVTDRVIRSGSAPVLVIRATPAATGA